ncbi:MAG: MFS family permease [Gammaproteobacteria bacterium]|jgi:MFS family permease
MNKSAGSVEVSYGWVVVFASLAIHSIGLGAPSMLFVALKPIAADLNTARAVPSFAYSLMMVGAGVGGIAMGWWMDKRGIIQPVLFGATMIGIGAIVASQAQGRFSLYLACGLLIGLLGKAAMIAPLIANATRWFDRRRGLAVAIISSGQGVAGALWPSLIRYMNDAYGWRETFFFYGVFALVTMIPLAWFLRTAPPAAHGPAAATQQALARPCVLGLPPRVVQGALWLAVIGCCTGMAIPIVHLFSHATDLGHSAATAATMLSVLFTAGFISRIGFGMLADRVGAMPTLLIGSVCQTAMLVVFANVTGESALFVAALLFGLGFSGIMPCYALIIRLLFPVSEAGWRIAAQYLFAALGMALGGWMGGATFDLTGQYTIAFYIGAGFGVMNFILIWSLFSRHRKPDPAALAAA